MLVAIPLGAVVSVTTAVVLVQALGGSEDLVRTMAPKSSTTPVAIALSDTVGGCHRCRPSSRSSRGFSEA